MPKQILKLEQFHGGLSSNSDPRDIADNELSSAQDIMVDELGKIRTLGGTTAHDASSNPVVTIEPGYGLFQFSHDRLGAETSGVLTVDDLTPSVSDYWQINKTHTNIAQTSSSGNGEGIICNITTDGSGDPTFSIVTFGYNYVIDEVIVFTDPGSTSETANIVVATFYGEGVPETGEDYLVLANTAIFTDATCDYNNDPTVGHDSNASIVAGLSVSGDGIPNGAYIATITNSTSFELSVATTDGSVTNGTLTFGGGLQMYAQNNDKWSTGSIINLGSTTDMKPTFYTVDGALRISDGNFGSNNSNKWYGYIGRELFSDLSPSYDINQWYVASQKISAPNKSTWDDNVNITSGYGETSSQVGSSSIDHDVDIDLSTLFAASVNNVTKAEVSYTFLVNSSGSSVNITFEAGTYDSGAFVVSDIQNVTQNNTEAGTYTGVLTFYPDAADTITDGTVTWDDFRVKIHDGATGIKNTGITNLKCYESGSLPDRSSSLSNNNIHIDFDWETATGALGWNNADNTGEWKVGVTFIYDGIQESQITTIVDVDDNSVSSFVVPGSLGVTAAPSIRLFIADFQTVSTAWNKRITGCNIYMQDVAQNITQPWFLQLSADFENGKLKVEHSQKEYDVLYYAEANQEYYYWEIGDGATDGSVMLTPANVITYGINSGLLENEKSVLSKYKTAVVVGRIVYIGGLEFQNEDGSTEVRGDAMIKSPVNKFDLFPLSRLIEVSVQDGDNIVKLEEYADRILQFKKNKMHLINVSQELEFLEDTFMHKGVSHPAATCKTDFGIAWVNKFGCYLYDGQKVTNLLEKGGRQIIKESEWDNFLRTDKTSSGTRLTPMIGYLPKKRQLIVYDDITNGGTVPPAMYLYDMVTQSWTTGTTDSANRIIDIAKTNFVTDWNGDLVYAHTSGTLVKWDDTSDVTDGTQYRLVTKDIDFGQPGVRKKLYKVIITYKSSGDTGIRVQWLKDGVPASGSYANDFDYTDSTNFTSGTLDTSSGLWQIAELKPDTTSESKKIKSIRLWFWDNAAVPADFEINDISIVYRLKNIK